MAKIENDRQLRITRRWIKAFRDTMYFYEHVLTSKWAPQYSDSPIWVKLQIDAARAMTQDLLGQVSIYLKEKRARPYIKHRRIRFKQTNT